ncbi:MAG TPA: hypothetical protein VLB89_04195 [Gaiellaceae bacterium]|nr:hypothetical protein [Gaiellaceae bacterium]
MDRIELLDDHFVIRNRGAHRLLTIVGDVAIRYEAIASVDVGLDSVPPWFTRRVGYSTGIGSRRAGIFWWRGRKWFMDVRDPARTLVVHVKPGAAYGAIAVTLDDAELVAGELRRVLEA